ncbi:trypsin-like serine protease [Glutamicibacter sp. AOP12-B1-11]|uniref:trypsin-like serine protease n=1 Tax=Glutamicibacter sp. AOP12-B1-11 TaxID=3457725 RepID=UPI004033F5C3
MPKPKNMTAQRGIVAAAATALVVGGSFIAPAVAADKAESTPAPSQSPSATPSASDVAVDTKGLDEAIERDLNKSPEKYLEDAKANDTVAEVTKKLEAEGVKVKASVKDGKAEFKVAAKDAKKTKDVIASSAAPLEAELVTVPKITSVNELYSEVVEKVQPEEVEQLTAILDTEEGLQIIAGGIASNEGPTKMNGKSSQQDKSPSPRASKSADKNKLTLDAFAAQAGVDLVETEGEGKASASAIEDIYGGMGYGIAPSGQDPTFLCSVGFNAWDPSGADAIITAGHCTQDGAMTDTYVVEHGDPDQIEGISNKLGTFGFSQFGGPNNSGTPGVPEKPELGTDIAVIDAINPDLMLHDQVSEWPANQDERESTIQVTGVATATVGAQACSSGRTTGWSCSEIIGEGLFFVGGYDDDVRAVWGYTAPNPNQSVLDQGDSGGAVLIGNKAVGINSANSGGEDGLEDTADDLAFYTGLVDAQERISGVADYQVKFFVEAPAQSSPAAGAEVKPGATITGKVEGASTGTQVRIVVDGKLYKLADVKADGTFTFVAPAEEGEFSFRMTAVNGFNKSGNATGSVLVAAPEPTPTPTPTPTEEPTATPTEEPTATPTEEPTESATPTEEPTATPTEEPTATPTEEPTESATPTEEPTATPTEEPTESATPTEEPTESATPTEEPTESAKPTPTEDDSEEPTEAPKDDQTPTKSPEQKDPLADTGSSTVPLIAAGGALALVGAMFLLFRRGNRRHS